MSPLTALALLVPALLALVATLVARARAKQAARRRAAAAAAEVIEKTGLALDGDPLGRFDLRGQAHGVAIVIQNRITLDNPGSSDGGMVGACAVKIGVPLADQMVCHASEADQVMGPLPAAPRVTTGDARFDRFYAIFVSPAGGAREESYRMPAGSSAAPWAAQPLLDALVALGLRWLRVRGGRAEIVFPPLAAEDMARAIAVAVALAHAAEGKPLQALPPPR